MLIIMTIRMTSIIYKGACEDIVLFYFSVDIGVHNIVNFDTYLLCGGKREATHGQTPK